MRVAVIGAGLGGLAAARTLADQGAEVVVLEKSGGVGGRSATRRLGLRSFDHGAQYFTARHPDFRAQVERWCDAGVVARWEGIVSVIDSPGAAVEKPGTERFVGVPGMNALGKRLARRLDVRRHTHVTAVTRDGALWRVADGNGVVAESFDAVVVNMPPAQAASLLEGVTALAGRLPEQIFTPCVAAMASLDSPPGLAFDGAFVNGGPLAWVCRNNSKPGRPGDEAWVLHSTAEWSIANFRAPDAGAELWQAFEEWTGADGARLDCDVTVQRWRYAMAALPLDDGCLWDPDHRVAVCGDWCRGNRIEGAYLSGLDAAGRVLNG